MTIERMIFSTFITLVTPDPAAPPSPANPGWPFLTALEPWLRFVPVAAGLIALGALVVAIIGLATSRGSKKLAREALRISKAKEERAMPNLKLEVVDGLDSLKRVPSHLLSFEIRAVNPSESANSVQDIWLQVNYRVGRSSSQAMFQPERNSAASNPQFPLPSTISGFGTVQGWCDFVIPQEVSAGWEHQRYALVCRDVHGSLVEQPAVATRKLIT